MSFINDIKTIFTVSGDQEVARASDRVGRSQTRLGQGSANASRQFAAQSSGLGGLVAAYAGAAATAFALQAAFDGLARSARAIQTLEGLTALAAQTAQDGQRIVQSVREITNAQMTLVESAELVNLSLSAGFNADQIDGLADVALRASRALGRDLTDAYTRVIRGSAKLETELLDELGIYTKIAPATRAYAAATGQAVSDLTEFERRQAFVNSVIAEGQRKFSAISTTVPTASEKIEAFGTKIVDLATQVGAFLARVLAPIAEFFTENFGASWGALAAAGFLVLRKGAEELNNTLNRSIENIALKVQGLRERLSTVSAEAVRAGQEAARNINLSRAGLGGAVGKELKDLRDLARQRALNSAELLRANALQQTRLERLRATTGVIKANIASLKRQRTGLIASGQSVAYVNSQLAEQGKKLVNNRKIINNTTASMKALTAATTRTTSVFGIFVATAYSGMLKVGAAVARVGVAFISLTGWLMGAIAIVGVLGSAIAKFFGVSEELSTLLGNIGQAAKNLFNSLSSTRTYDAIGGVVRNSLREIQEIDSRFRDIEEFTFSKKFLGIEIEVTQTIEDLAEEVNSAVDSAYDQVFQTMSERERTLRELFAGAVASSAGLIGGAYAGTFVYEALSPDEALTQDVIDRLRVQYAGLLEGLSEEAELVAINALNILQETSAAYDSLDPGARAAVRLMERLVVETSRGIENLETITAIMTATGMDAAQIVENFDLSIAAADAERIYGALSTASISIEGQDIDFSFIDTANEELVATLTIRTELEGEGRGVFTQIAQNALRELNMEEDTTFRTYRSRLTTIISLAATEGLDQGMANFALYDEGGSFYNAVNRLAEEAGMSIREFIGMLATDINIGQVLSPIIADLNDINGSAVRAANVLYELSENITTGSVNMEQFDQAVVSARTSIEQSDRALIGVNDQLEEARRLVALGTLEREEEQRVLALIAELEERRVSLASETLEPLRQALAILEAQENTVRRRVELEEFLSSISAESPTIFEATAAAAEAAGSSTSAYLASLAEQASVAGAAYANLQERISNASFGSDIGGLLLSTGTEDFAELELAVESLGSSIERIGTSNIVRIFTPVTDASGQISVNMDEVVLLSREFLALGAENAAVQETLVTLAEQHASDSAVLLATTRDTIEELEERVDISNRELAIAQLAAHNEERRLAALREELKLRSQMLGLERGMELAEMRLDVERLTTEATIRTQETLIANTQITLNYARIQAQEQQRSLQAAQALYNIYSAIGQAVSTIALDVAGGSDSERAAAELNAQLYAITDAYAQQRELVQLQRQAAEEDYRLQLLIAQRNINIALAEQQIADNTFEERAALLRSEEELANLRNTEELKVLLQRRADIEYELRELSDRAALEQTNLVNRIRADREKAIADAENLERTIQAYARAEIAQTAFTNRFAAIVNALAQIEGITIEGLPEDVSAIGFGDIQTSVSDAILEINRLYDTLENNAIQISSLQEESSRERLQAELESLNAQIQAQREYNTEFAELNNRRVALEVAALISERTARRQAFSAAAAEYASLYQELENRRQEFTDQENQAAAQAIQGIMQQAAALTTAIRQGIDSFEAEVTAAMEQIQQIAQEEIVLSMRFELDRSNLERELYAQTEQFALAMLQARADLISAQEASGSMGAEEAAQETNRLQQEILNQQELILVEQFKRDEARREQEDAILQAEAQMSADRLAAEAAANMDRINAEYDVLDAQISSFQNFITDQQSVNNNFLTSQADVFNQFGDGLAAVFNGLITALGSAFEGVEGFSGVSGGIEFSAITAELGAEISGTFDELRRGLGESRDAALRANNDVLQARIEALQLETDRALELSALRGDIAEQEFIQQMALLEMQRLIEEENAAARIASAEEAGGAAEEVTDTLRDRLLAIYDSIQSNLENAFMELNDLLFYGEGDFGEILGNLFRSIQTDIFQTTIAEPLSRLITDNLFAAFGFEGGRQGIENARVGPDGALFVRPVEELFGIQGVIDKSGEYLNNQNQGFLGGLFGQTRQEMSGIFGGGGFLSQLLQSLFGQGGLFASLLRGIGNLFSNIFGGIGGGGGLFGGLFGGGGISGGVLKASGGFVHMAQGGMLGASALRRDRVPTMLEPGEFVIRRAAARNIGAANLQAMNATGQAAGNVQVNVTNNGTPQEATASPPKFDGEKYVIDIVTRDLANNGPIRRSIRGGAL